MFRWERRENPLEWYDPLFSVFLESKPKDFKQWSVPSHHPLESLYMIKEEPKINKNFVFHFVFVKKLQDWVSDSCGYSSEEVPNWADVIKSWLKSSVVYTKSTHEGLAVFGENQNEFFLIPWFETITCAHIRKENEILELVHKLQVISPPSDERAKSPMTDIINELETSLGLTRFKTVESDLSKLLLSALAAEERK